jgi:hypothetical protein
VSQEFGSLAFWWQQQQPQGLATEMKMPTPVKKMTPRVKCGKQMATTRHTNTNRAISIALPTCLLIFSMR